jgi:hypothetical protein
MVLCDEVIVLDAKFETEPGSGQIEQALAQRWSLVIDG